MKRVTLTTLIVLLSASLAWADDEATFLEGQLRAWQQGQPGENGARHPDGVMVPGTFFSPPGAKRLLRYEIIGVVLAQMNGVDTALVNALCVFEAERAPEAPAAEVTWRVVFRVSADAKAEGGFRLAAAWRSLGVPARPAASAGDVKPFNLAQKTLATKLIAQLRNPKLDPGARNQKRDQLAAFGPAVVATALRDLRTSNMEHRAEIVQLVRRVRPPNEAAILREELTYAAGACTRLVSRIQDDGRQAEEYRERAAKIRTPTGGGYGGLKVKPEPTDRDSYLRLAARYDEKVADSRRELDACAEVIETVACDVAASGDAADFALLLGLVTDKSAPARATAWSAGVIADGEWVQVPAVGFSTRRAASVPDQEQDWLPWGPLWGALRARIRACPAREPLLDLRERMEQAFVPAEKKRAATWQQAAIVTEFHRTEQLLIERLAEADGPKPSTAKEADYEGEERDRLRVAMAGLPEKKGEDDWDRRRRAGRQEEMRRSAEFVTWRVVMTLAPTDPDGAPRTSGPCFLAGAFDNFRERLSVTALLEVEARPDGTAHRVVLGTRDLPLRAALAADVASGRRRARLELRGRLKAAQAGPRTIGNVTDLLVPVELDRLVLVDDATNEVLADALAAPKKPEAEAPPRPSTPDDDTDVTIKR